MNSSTAAAAVKSRTRDSQELWRFPVSPLPSTFPFQSYVNEEQKGTYYGLCDCDSLAVDRVGLKTEDKFQFGFPKKEQSGLDSRCLMRAWLIHSEVLTGFLKSFSPEPQQHPTLRGSDTLQPLFYYLAIFCFACHRQHFVHLKRISKYLGVKEGIRFKIKNTENNIVETHTCRWNVRTTAHLKQLQGGAVIGHQDFEGRVVHRRVVNLQGGQRLGVDEHHRQRRGEVRLCRKCRARGHCSHRHSVGDQTLTPGNVRWLVL